MNTKQVMKMTVVLAFSGILLTACANRRNQNIIVDMKGVDEAQYQADLLECQEYVEQVKPQAGEKAAGGAIGGALIGAALGDHNTAKRFAGVGAVSGAGKGAEATQKEKKQVVRNCLAGRGYNVLN